MYVTFVVPSLPHLSRRIYFANTGNADSIMFLLVSLTFIAAILYLPHHVSILSGRVWYYINGDHIDVVASARAAVEHIVASGGAAKDSNILPEVTKAAVEGAARVKSEL